MASSNDDLNKELESILKKIQEQKVLNAIKQEEQRILNAIKQAEKELVNLREIGVKLGKRERKDDTPISQRPWKKQRPEIIQLILDDLIKKSRILQQKFEKQKSENAIIDENMYNSIQKSNNSGCFFDDSMNSYYSGLSSSRHLEKKEREKREMETETRKIRDEVKDIYKEDVPNFYRNNEIFAQFIVDYNFEYFFPELFE